MIFFQPRPGGRYRDDYRSHRQMCNQCLIMFGEVREGQFYSLLFEYCSLHSEHCQTLLTCLVTEEARAPDPPWTSPLTTSSECRILCLTMPVTCRGWTIVNSWYDYQAPSQLILNVMSL